MGLTKGAMGYITQLDIDISKGSLARKLPKLRAIVMVSIPTIMYHTVMSTTSSSSSWEA
jgi:hypothetical protein